MVEQVNTPEQIGWCVVREYSGIVLKKEFPKSAKIVLLDSAEGKISVVPSSQDLCVAALIQYHRSPARRGLIYNVETIALPLSLAHDDILFLHHILELLFYFLSTGEPVPAIFSLVHELYLNQQKPLSSLYKKIFVAQLLLLLGMYPERDSSHTAQLHRIISEPIDIIVTQGLESDCEQFLNEWLLSCVSMHPKIALFKTVHFLDESRVV